MYRYLNIHICISGFTQDRGYYHGILRLREELIHRKYASGPTSRVWYATWRTNWALLAADLAQVCVRHGLRPVVQIHGYSYGGYGALELCRHLEMRGIQVRVLNLSDPVGRRWWWPRPLPALTSLISRDYAFHLSVPANVELVNEFYQKENRPQGHQLRLDSDTTTRGISQRLPHIHQRMDDAPEFHDCVLDHAERVREHLALEEAAQCGA